MRKKFLREAMVLSLLLAANRMQRKCASPSLENNRPMRKALLPLHRRRQALELFVGLF